MCVFLFFKQKTAYEMRISDWSSDVCSSDLFDSLPAELQTALREEALKAGDIASHGTEASLAKIEADLKAAGVTVAEIDVTPFREATAGVYDTLGYDDLRDTLQKMASD